MALKELFTVDTSAIPENRKRAFIEEYEALCKKYRFILESVSHDSIQIKAVDLRSIQWSDGILDHYIEHKIRDIQ